MSLIPKDTELQFPHQFTIPASAGSGKTFTLSHRYVQFLLSSNIPSNGLRNILAITFTKLAAKEMKERILKVLKEAAIGDSKALQNLSSIVSLSDEELSIRSEQLVNQILHNYSDFNVRTIDSFLTTVFKASAMELGVQPNVAIEFDNDAVIDQAFRQYSQNLREGSSDAQFIDDLIALIESNDAMSGGYLWNPFTKIIREVRQLQKQFGRFSKEPIILDGEKDLAELKFRIIKNAQKLKILLSKTSLPVSAHFANDVERLSNGDVLSVATKGKKKKYFNKYSDDAGAKKEIKHLFVVISPLEADIEKYLVTYAHTYYQPFVRAVSMIDQTMRDVKLLEGKVVIDDINRSLAHFLSDEVVPEVYLKLGERISHFMIDEFQDTSPIQWKNLYSLIDEALSKGGSLFAVGDTKQSIYSFRGGDWKIFRNLIEKQYFPSAPAQKIPLETNYRSAQVLVEFVKEVFSTNVVKVQLDQLASQSGLYNFAQDVPEGERKKGFVEVKRIDKNDDESSSTLHRDYIISTIRNCQKRGYSLGDIAILTPANADVVEISSWLNNASIDFLSLSTLDIRKRKIVGEIIALLKFLDSPIDNLAFSTFIFGDVFKNIFLHENAISNSKSFRRKPESKSVDSSIYWNHNIQNLRSKFIENKKDYFYRTFQKHYPKLWERYFDRLFALVGYMPLYDIVSEVLKTFSVFEVCSTEESALIKLLECVTQFENTGNNSLKDFLSFSTEQGSEGWSVSIPGNVNAVRIMTVHKAKGLGFPVVIVSLQEKRSKTSSLITQETDAGLSVIRVGKSYGDRNEALGNMYQEREDEQTIDELNKIYVALTRARKEMYVVTLFKKEEHLPASILPEGTYGVQYQKAEKEKEEEKLPLFRSVYQTEQSNVHAAAYQKIGLSETHRGDAVHNVLAQIEYVNETLEEDIRTALQHPAIEYQENIDHETSNLIQFLSLPPVRQYFESKTNRIVLREQDIAAANGRLYRMDRVIVDSHEVTVLDFKTGKDDHGDDYQEQVRNYMNMLKDIYPSKTVKGALLYIDMLKEVPVL